MTLFECHNVGFSRNGQDILTQVSFSLKEGSSLGIVGPSGSGKSTLLRLLNLLYSPTAGTILYKGTTLGEFAPTLLRREISYVLQKPYLFGTTVWDNLAYPYQLQNRSIDKEEILEYLHRGSLPSGILEKKPSALSGGEQQRVALIRSLLTKPKVLLLDEITSALDEETTHTVEQLLLSEKAAQNQTLLLITHNKAQAERFSDTILQLEQGQVTYFGSREGFFAQAQGGSYE